MVKKKKYELDDVRKMVFKGAVAVKGTDLLRHAQSPVALQGDISGFAGLGVAGAMSEVAAGALKFGKKKRKRKKGGEVKWEENYQHI